MSRDALIVGINSYISLPKLTAPACDAEAIAQRLSSSGNFKVWRLPEILLDEEPVVGQKTNISLVQLQTALVQLFKPEGNQFPDTALFYFSGHGLRNNLGISEGFLATSDADPTTGFYGLSLNWLRRLLEESPIRQQIIWLDCCHSGEILNFRDADPGDRGKGRDRCFIAASREFEPAYEDIRTNHSVLTKVLLDGLAPDKFTDRWITNLSLTDFINEILKNEIQAPTCNNFGEPINLIHSSNTSRDSKNPQIPYPIIYRYLKQRSMTLFCGEDSPQNKTDKISNVPSCSDFTKYLAEHANYPGEKTDPLSKIAQFVEEVPADRNYLINTITEVFNNAVQDCQNSYSSFLSFLPNSLLPKLIITTSYDTALEQALSKKGIDFFAISHIMHGSQYAGRFLVYDSLKSPLGKENIKRKKELDIFLTELDFNKIEPVLIYKINGTAHQQSQPAMLDTIVLTENDYADLLSRQTAYHFPSRLIQLLRKQRLLFLGYSLTDWNFRILLQKLQVLQGMQKRSSTKNFACISMSDSVEKQFWQQRGINIYEVEILDFLENLKSEIEANLP